MAFFQLLACWDVEFALMYLTDPDNRTGTAPQPIFELLMPALSPSATEFPNGTYRSRGLFHPPLRRLLDLCYCFSVRHREGRWPGKARVTRAQVAGAGGTVLQGDASEQPLAKIRKGLRGLSAKEFEEVWMSMIGSSKGGESISPPWPCYLACQILTLLFTEKNSRGTKSMILPTPTLYRYWWERYLAEFKTKGAHFGNLPWPSYLKVV